MLQHVVAVNLGKHRPRKQAVPCLLRDDADRQTVLLVGARVAVLHKDVAALQISLQPRQQRTEAFAGERPVVGAPPDFVFGRLLAYHELVGRRACRVLAGIDYQRTKVRQAPFGAEDALLIQRRRRQVPVDAPQVGQPMVLQAVAAGQLSGLIDCGRLDIEIDVHTHSLTSLWSPR